MKQASRQTEIVKCGKHLKGDRGRVDVFSNFVEECKRSVANESCALANVIDAVGLKSNQSRAGCIGSHRVVGKHNLSQRTGGAVEGLFPSIATMPSAITKWTGTEAQGLRMLAWIEPPENVN